MSPGKRKKEKEQGTHLGPATTRDTNALQVIWTTAILLLLRREGGPIPLANILKECRKTLVGRVPRPRQVPFSIIDGFAGTGNGDLVRRVEDMGDCA